MKIKYLCISCGPEGSAKPGDIKDVPEKIARGLIAGGYAVAIEPMPKEAKSAEELPEEKREAIEDEVERVLEETSAPPVEETATAIKKRKNRARK